MKDIKEIFAEYQIDENRGFLPSIDPILHLPKEYEAWDDLALNLTKFINAGIIRKKIQELPIISNPQFQSEREQERAMLLLSFFAHAFVHSPPTPANFIPSNIAIPWVNIASQINRKPILSHSSVVLNNWQRIDSSLPIRLNNLATICQFHGGLDESWFYLVTVEIEAVGAPAISFLLQTISHIHQKNWIEATHCLNQVNLILQELTLTLQKMYNHCDPQIFYLRVRPFLASFQQIEYQGTSLDLQNHHGGSAAQSSLLQFFDAALGIKYENLKTEKYLKLMRQHMPKKHVDFLAFIETSTNIKTHVAQHSSLERTYQKVIQQLIEFRDEHLKMVAIYIMQQAKKNKDTAIGTGGTNPLHFLKSVRNQNKQFL